MILNWVLGGGAAMAWHKANGRYGRGPENLPENNGVSVVKLKCDPISTWDWQCPYTELHQSLNQKYSASPQTCNSVTKQLNDQWKVTLHVVTSIAVFARMRYKLCLLEGLTKADNAI